MQRLSGQLSFVSLTSVLQLLEQNRLTGTLQVKQRSDLKNIYLQAGRITFVGSGTDSENFWSCLETEINISAKQVKTKISYIYAMEKSLIDSLLKKKLATEEQLHRVFRKLILVMDSDACAAGGSFSFSDGVPHRFKNRLISFGYSQLFPKGGAILELPPLIPAKAALGPGANDYV